MPEALVCINTSINSAEEVFEELKACREVQEAFRVHGVYDIVARVKGENFEDLFFQWLSEIIFIKDAERFLMKRAEINFEKEGQAALQGRLFGDSIDPKRHILKTDVKAVTFYKFRVEKMGEIWKAEVVFDL